MDNCAFFFPPVPPIQPLWCRKLYTLKFSQQTKRTRRKRKYCICDGKCGSTWFPSPCLSESVTWPTCCDAFSPPIQVKMKKNKKINKKITFLSQIKFRITFPSCTLIWGKVHVFHRSTANLSETFFQQSLLPHMLVLLPITPGLRACTLAFLQKHVCCM